MLRTLGGSEIIEETRLQAPDMSSVDVLCLRSKEEIKVEKKALKGASLKILILFRVFFSDNFITDS